MSKLAGLGVMIRAIVLLAISVHALHALCADDTSAGKPTLVVRAAGPLPDDALTKFTKLVDARKFERKNYPDLRLLTPRQVVSVLCGSFRTAYWDQFKRINDPKSIPGNPDEILGERAYSLQWPGCPFVQEQPSFKYVVKAGDTAFAVYKSLTGAAGSRAEVMKYFKASHAVNLTQLKIGQTLQPAHITAPTVVSAAMDFTQLRDSISSITNVNIAQAFASTGGASATRPAPPVPPPAAAQPPGPRFQIAAGRIQSASTASYTEPAECKGADQVGPIFDPMRLVAAYDDSLAAMRTLNIDRPTTKVVVADNGFFGARFQDGKLKFGPQFPGRLFLTSIPGDEGQPANDGQIGPLTNSGGGNPIYPINYSNNLTTVDVVSGHGTHVTGLVIGGPLFQPYLSVFDRAGEGPWMRLWIINIGDGKETLIPNSVSELSLQVNLLSNSIINLSIEYPPLGAIPDSYLLHLVESPVNNLFIVSAGNDGSGDVSEAPYYPAVLGGMAQKNVITVAASLPDGRLASFSNRGRENVDLAAPGCEMASWLDDSGKVSEVSGTSQAAAFVTFAATLLKSLGDLRPVEIKNRLMMSGDPLAHDAAPPRAAETSPGAKPAPEEILSRSRLNIVRSLYLFDDYVRYRTQDGQMHESLGVFQGFTGVTCQGQIQWRNVWSLKASDGGLLLYKGKLTPQQIIGEPCMATASADAQLRLQVRADIDAQGVPNRVSTPKMLTVPIAYLDEYVSASRPYRAQP